jgi:hypothetical protein
MCWSPGSHFPVIGHWSLVIGHWSLVIRISVPRRVVRVIPAVGWTGRNDRQCGSFNRKPFAFEETVIR